MGLLITSIETVAARCIVIVPLTTGGDEDGLVRIQEYIAGRALTYHHPEAIIGVSGCSAAWVARLLWEQEVEGSNPFTPTIFAVLGFLQSRLHRGRGP